MAGFVEATMGELVGNSTLSSLVTLNFISIDIVGYSSNNSFLLLILTDSNTCH